MRGVPMTVWKHVPGHRGAKPLRKRAGHGAREFLVYEDERVTYDGFRARRARAGGACCRNGPAARATGWRW